MSTNDLLDVIENLNAELAHVKANHKNLVDKNAILRERPDLPVDRIPAVRRLEELVTENTKLHKLIITEADEWLRFSKQMHKAYTSNPSHISSTAANRSGTIRKNLEKIYREKV